MFGQNYLDKIKNKNNAIEKCYLTSNEILGEYLNKINFKNKRVATVGSSGDQFLNALYYGSKDITVIDANPYARAFIEYKLALIKTYNFETFKYLMQTSEIFNWKIYSRISHLLSKNVQQFWDTLILEQMRVIEMDDEFIYFDDYRLHSSFIHEKFSPSSEFYANEVAYEKLKALLQKQDFKLKYIVADVTDFDKKLEGKYDVIMLSNIYNYMRVPVNERNAFHITLRKLYKSNLNPGGTIQVNYRFNTFLDEVPLKREFNLRKETVKEQNNGIYSIYSGPHKIYFIDKPEIEKEDETGFNI